MRYLVLAASLALIACSPKPEPAAAPAEAASAPAPAVEQAAAPVVDYAPGEGMARASAPVEGARISSPLQASGVAPNNWYHEAQFASRIELADGTVIAEAPARPTEDWMVPGDIPFIAEIPFEVTAETPAVLVLEEDMPPEDGPARQVRINVVLAPAG